MSDDTQLQVTRKHDKSLLAPSSPRSRLVARGRMDVAKYEERKQKYAAERAENCRELAESGDAWHQCQLGYLYYTAQGLPQDYAEAVHWFRKAIEEGQWYYVWQKAVAYYDLGLMYHNGHGVAQDHAEAAKCYRKAADWGDKDAQFNLGLMYENGQGVACNLVESHMWLELATSADRTRDSLPMSGDGKRALPESWIAWLADGETRYRAEQQRRARHLENLASMMTSEQIAEAQRRARQWKLTTEK